MEKQYTLSEIIGILTRGMSEREEQIGDRKGLAGLSPSKVRCLGLISELGDPTPTELANALKITKPSVTAILDKLESEALIRKVRSDEDARSWRISLTDKGKDIARLHREIHSDLAGHISRGLDPEEEKELNRLLNKVIRTFDKE